VTLSPLPLGLTRVIHCVYCIHSSRCFVSAYLNLVALYVYADERVSVNAIRPVYVLVDGNSSQTTKAWLLLVSLFPPHAHEVHLIER